MQLPALMRLPLIFLALSVLTSCVHATPGSPISFSAQIKAAIDSQRATDCAQLQPKPIPETASPEWIGHAAKAAENWRTFCKP